MTTNFLKFYRASSARLTLALAAGASGVNCSAGEGRIYSSNGLLLGWAVTLGSKSMGVGLRISFWGSSPTFFPLPSSVNIGEFFSHGQTVAPISKDSNNSCC